MASPTFRMSSGGRSDAAMIENFIEYMWYLLTTPLKKLKKALNKWYTLCRVFGRRFDEAKEDILRARDEGCQLVCPHKNRGGIAKGLHCKQNPFIGAPKLAELIIHGYS